jgi:hypothetical protein
MPHSIRAVFLMILIILLFALHDPNSAIGQSAATESAQTATPTLTLTPTLAFASVNGKWSGTATFKTPSGVAGSFSIDFTVADDGRTLTDVSSKTKGGSGLTQVGVSSKDYKVVDQTFTYVGSVPTGRDPQTGKYSSVDFTLKAHFVSPTRMEGTIVFKGDSASFKFTANSKIQPSRTPRASATPPGTPTTATVMGKFTLNNKPLANETLELRDGSNVQQKVKTGAGGVFKFTVIPPGTYSITASTLARNAKFTKCQASEGFTALKVPVESGGKVIATIVTADNSDKPFELKAGDQLIQDITVTCE